MKLAFERRSSGFQRQYFSLCNEAGSRHGLNDSLPVPILQVISLYPLTQTFPLSQCGACLLILDRQIGVKGSLPLYLLQVVALGPQQLTRVEKFVLQITG